MKALLLTALLATTAQAEISVTSQVTNFSEYDLNQDSTVDMADFDIFRPLFGSNDPVGDFNNDGIVDLTDFSLFRSAFGTQKVTIDVICR